MVGITPGLASAGLHLNDLEYTDGGERVDSIENLLDENGSTLQSRCRGLARRLFCEDSCIANFSSQCSCLREHWGQISETRVGAFFQDKGLDLLVGGVAVGAGIYAKHLYETSPQDTQWHIDVGYAVLCLTHGYLAVKKYQQSRKAVSAMHGTCTMLSLYYPIAQHSGVLHAGWHHMSYALACMVTEYKAVCLFGALMAGDELVYYNELGIFKNQMGDYGLDNHFQDHFKLVLAFLAVATITEMVITHCRSRNMSSSQAIPGENNLSSTTTVLDSGLEMTELGELSAIV